MNTKIQILFTVFFVSNFFIACSGSAKKSQIDKRTDSPQSIVRRFFNKQENRDKLITATPTIFLLCLGKTKIKCDESKNKLRNRNIDHGIKVNRKKR